MKKKKIDQKTDEHEICKMEVDKDVATSSVQGDDNVAVHKDVTENVKGIQEKGADGQSSETEKKWQRYWSETKDINNNQVAGSLNKRDYDSSAETLDIHEEMSTEKVTKKVTFEMSDKTSDESFIISVLNTLDKVINDAVVDLQMIVM